MKRSTKLNSNFRFEFEMAQPVWEYFNKFSNEKYAFFPVSEFVTPWGIPDLVLLKLDIKKINSRVNDKLTAPIIGRLAALVMNTLKYGQKTSIKKLSTVCSKNSSFLKNSILNYLLEENYINEPIKDYFIKNKKYSRITSDIIAVELKRTDWKSAINQAQRYRLFADRVYVALPESGIKNVSKNLKLFKQCDVGLLSTNLISAKKILHSRKMKPLSGAARTICEEKAFSNLLKIRNTSSLSAVYKFKPSLQMNTTRLSFRLKESLVL